jgi:hypothetical protein
MSRLDTKEAVRLAKEWVASQFADEGIEDLGLEEVTMNNGEWEITLGFARHWDLGHLQLPGIAGLVRPRTYKIVTVSDLDGTVTALRNREAA